MLFAHWPAALIAVSTMWALANSWATVAAVSGKRLGSITVGCGGQTMRTMAGMPSRFDQLDRELIMWPAEPNLGPRSCNLTQSRHHQVCGEDASPTVPARRP